MIHDQRSFDPRPGHGNPRDAYGGGDARLIESFTPLVRKLAWHLAPSAGSAMDVDDLMQIGLIALTECARRHDRPTDDGLAAYAKLRVRGAMIDAIRKMQTETRGARAERVRLDNARTALANRLGRQPDNAEFARDLGISAAQLAERQNRSAPVSQVDMGDCYDESSAVFASEQMDAEDLLLEVESSDQLAAAIAALSQRHQMVIQLYFIEELNLAEIAQVLDVSVPRVHQIKAAALKELREALT